MPTCMQPQATDDVGPQRFARDAERRGDDDAAADGGGVAAHEGRPHVASSKNPGAVRQLTLDPNDPGLSHRPATPNTRLFDRALWDRPSAARRTAAWSVPRRRRRGTARPGFPPGHRRATPQARRGGARLGQNASTARRIEEERSRTATWSRRRCSSCSPTSSHRCSQAAMNVRLRAGSLSSSAEWPSRMSPNCQMSGSPVCPVGL